MGCDMRGFSLILHFIEFQSTHPHGVRLDNSPKLTFTSTVSIHAPTWGATVIDYLMVSEQRVSIHAPTWGATFRYSTLAALISKFQSTHPHGVRPGIPIHICVLLLFQSTHPHGVRLIANITLQCTKSFNPRTHMGCDSWSLL